MRAGDLSARTAEQAVAWPNRPRRPRRRGGTAARWLVAMSSGRHSSSGGGTRMIVSPLRSSRRRTCRSRASAAAMRAAGRRTRPPRGRAETAAPARSRPRPRPRRGEARLRSTGCARSPRPARARRPRATGAHASSARVTDALRSSNAARAASCCSGCTGSASGCCAGKRNRASISSTASDEHDRDDEQACLPGPASRVEDAGAVHGRSANYLSVPRRRGSRRTQHDRVVHCQSGPGTSAIHEPAAVLAGSRPSSLMRIAIAHSPDSDDAFMFYGLASGKVPTGGSRDRTRPVGYRVAQPRGVRGPLRDQRRLVPRLHAPGGPLHSAAARREHGRSLRPGRRRARAAAGVARRRDGRDPGDADDGVSRAAHVQPGRAVRGDAVRPDPGGGARRARAGRADHPRGAAHLRQPKVCTRSWTSASGGPIAPAACRCRSAAT